MQTHLPQKTLPPLRRKTKRGGRASQTPQSTSLGLIAYGAKGCIERHNPEIADIKTVLDSNEYTVVWINVDGLQDVEKLRELGKVFAIHPLALEDVINVYQRPKLEPYDCYLYLVMRMADLGSAIDTEQLSMFIGKNFVLTLQERPGDCFQSTRERIRKDSGLIRRAGTGYLAYTLLDAAIDDYFPILSHISDKLEKIEDEILYEGTSSTKRYMPDLYQARNDLTQLRRAIWPLRDAVGSLQRDATGIINEETRVYFRDCHDHTVQLIDAIESYREIVATLTELYLSNANYKLNDIMRILTIISVLFMPLNFIAGLYGMNFDPDRSPFNMPELRWFYGYPFALGLMIFASSVMMLFVRRKGWLKG